MEDFIRRRRRLIVVLLFLTAFTFRLGCVLATGLYLLSGGVEMTRAAGSLARDGTLGNVYSADSGPSAHVAPVYPFLVSICYRLFGIETPAGLLAQSVLGIAFTSLGIAVLPLVAERARLAPVTGVIAAVLMAVMPFNLFTESAGSWEQALIAPALMGLFAGFCVMHERAWDDRTGIVLLGFYLGLCALISPVLVAPAGLMMAAEFLTQRGQRRPLFLSSLAMVGTAAIVLAPWLARNLLVLGGVVPLRSNFGLELSLGNNDLANGVAWDQKNTAANRQLRELHPFTNERERAEVKRVGELRYMQEKSRLGRQWIADHPAQFLRLTATRLRLYWLPAEEVWPDDTSRPRLKAALFSGLSVAAFAGLICVFAIGNPCRWLFVGILLGPGLPYLITSVSLRYRYPIFWVSMLLAVELVVVLTGRLRGTAALVPSRHT